MRVRSMRRAQAWKGSTVQEAWATPISPASWVEWASTCTRYSPARLSGARGGETVRATGAWPLGLSWIFSLSPVRRASPETQARGTPSTLTWKWSTMVPRLATVPRTTLGLPRGEGDSPLVQEHLHPAHGGELVAGWLVLGDRLLDAQPVGADA